MGDSVQSEFVDYALANGYNAELQDENILVRDVTNKGNDFKVIKIDGYYIVSTVSVSMADYEYTAKCVLYVVLAAFNRKNAEQHKHIKFKVDL